MIRNWCLSNWEVGWVGDNMGNILERNWPTESIITVDESPCGTGLSRVTKIVEAPLVIKDVFLQSLREKSNWKIQIIDNMNSQQCGIELSYFNCLPLRIV